MWKLNMDSFAWARWVSAAHTYIAVIVSVWYISVLVDSKRQRNIPKYSICDICPIWCDDYSFWMALNAFYTRCFHFRHSLFTLHMYDEMPSKHFLCTKLAYIAEMESEKSVSRHFKRSGKFHDTYGEIRKRKQHLGAFKLTQNQLDKLKTKILKKENE